MQPTVSSEIGAPGAGGTHRRRSSAKLIAALLILATATAGFVFSRSRAARRSVAVANATEEHADEHPREEGSPAEVAVAGARTERLLASREALRKAMLDLTVAGSEAEVVEPDVPHRTAEGRPPTVEELAMVEKALEKSSAQLPPVPADPDIMAGILATLHGGVALDIRFGLIHAYKDMVRSLPEAEAARALEQLNAAAGITP